MKKSSILFFDEIDQRDLPQVGGKGANLGELTKAGFPVPAGFCVTTESYRQFIEHNQLADFISQVLRDASPENISQIGAKIREKVKQSEIPAEVKQAIIDSIPQPDIYYAVRSSA